MQYKNLRLNREQLTILLEKELVHRRFNLEKLNNKLTTLLGVKIKVDLCAEHGASDYEMVADLSVYDNLEEYQCLTIWFLKVPYSECDEPYYITELIVEDF